MILPTIPERVDTPIFTITKRRKAFTVFALISIREAISLLVSPCTSSSTAWPSRSVRSYSLLISDTTPTRAENLSSKITFPTWLPLKFQLSRKTRQR